mmetsp:Transcript_45613/g.128810  ORF Transcript_45613/g.128810 Transcript_45613/m.128810 type:complete len:102 (+) Transcript_45613:1298-1603(+)
MRAQLLCVVSFYMLSALVQINECVTVHSIASRQPPHKQVHSPLSDESLNHTPQMHHPSIHPPSVLVLTHHRNESHPIRPPSLLRQFAVDMGMDLDLTTHQC